MNIDSKVVSQRIESLGLPLTGNLLDKTKEMLRKLSFKLPPGTLGKAESCRLIVAIEIACGVTNVPTQRTELVKMCSLNESEYSKLLMTCKTALGVSWSTASIEQVLSLKYSPEVVGKIQPILAKYEQLLVNKLPEQSRCYVNLDSNLYKGAAFCVALMETKQAKMKIDKDAIAHLADCSIAQLTKVYDSILKVWKTEESSNNSSNHLHNQQHSQPNYNTSTTDININKLIQNSSSSDNKRSILSQLRLQNIANQTISSLDVTENTLKDSTIMPIHMKRSLNQNQTNEENLQIQRQNPEVGVVTGPTAAEMSEREAYEIWRETMKQRKRSKLDR